MSEKTVSLESLNLTKDCEQGYEFELVDVKGNGSGISLIVLGQHAEEPKKAIRKRLNAEITQNAMLSKRGKDIPAKTVEDMRDDNLHDAAVYVIGWKGITEPCTLENIVKLFSINQEFMRQAIEESQKLENFTRSK
jgi:hypothetical protein